MNAPLPIFIPAPWLIGIAAGLTTLRRGVITIQQLCLPALLRELSHW